MINRKEGNTGRDVREGVSSIGPESASWLPSASWWVGCFLEAGSAPPPGSALHGTWA